MKLIVGLGNPDKEYTNTRHNIGFRVINEYLSAHQKDITWQNKFNALYTTLTLNNEKFLFIKPQTYMNLSGDSLVQFVNFYKVPLKDILVIHDDLDLPIGNYRLKINSSSGGHNGIKSIIERLGSNEFARLKIGISKNQTIDTKDYVLGKFTSNEQEILNNIYPTLIKIIDDFLIYDISQLMNKYNQKS